MGDDLFSREERLGRKEELRFKKRIKECGTEITLAPSPPMVPDWVRNPDFSKKLTFPCSEDELLSFIEITGLDQMLVSKELLLKLEKRSKHPEKSAAMPVSNKNFDEDNDKGNGAENYFILSDEHWKVRFNGGKEAIIGAGAPIKTLVKYLKSRDTVINPSDVYTALHCTQPENTSQECNLMAKNSVSSLNCDATKTLTATDINQYQEVLSEMIARKNLCVQREKIEDAENIDEEIVKTVEILKKEFDVVFDGKTGELTSANIKAKGRNSAAVNTRLHIKRAIEKLKGIEGLPEHIDIYLRRNKFCYQPPKDFPGWYISD